jgi:uncharacterized lipoprotein YehR (DUF1307 family)
LSTLRKIELLIVAAALAAVLAGCGDKVPQSEASKKIGEQPKQVLNKVEADVNKAVQKGIEQRQDAEKKE